ncbi:MAG: redoxin domain-containing protein [Pseudomonadales bacterium]|nr:redoxin domain-containing protein [Pseudomonadales bacterium]
MKGIIIAFLLGYSSMALSLEVGDIAPGFSLPGTDGQVHRLSDHRGTSIVILAWFPRAYTNGCTIECKSLVENGHILKQYPISYYMLSVDPIEHNIGFAEQQKADFPLLSDISKQTARAYDVLSDQGYAMRHTFYIGLDGRVLFIDRNVKPATSAADMVIKLRQLGLNKRVEKMSSAVITNDILGW